MKTIPGFNRAAGLLLVGTLAMPTSTWAQPAATDRPGPRADAAATVGALAVHKDSTGPFDWSRWHHTLFAGGGAGWYWNDHLKTEVDVGAGRRSRHYTTRQVIVDGMPVYVSTQSTFSRRILGVAQQYQFYRNAWFHPHVGAGADITWERRTDVTREVVIFDSRGQRRVVEPERTEGPITEVSVRPFLATGFKAYLTPRSFLRSDLRLALRGGDVDEVLVRLGFGIDF